MWTVEIEKKFGFCKCFRFRCFKIEQWTLARGILALDTDKLNTQLKISRLSSAEESWSNTKFDTIFLF